MELYKKHIIRTDKFKTVTLGLLIRNRLLRENTTKNSLLAHVLKRGSVNYPSFLSIAIKMEEFYGAMFDIAIIKKGEEQIINFMLDLPDENYTSDKFLSDAFKFLFDIFQNPKTANDNFDPKIVEAAKNDLKQLIEGKINDKKAYAVERCIEEAFEQEPFSVSADGYLEDLDSITANSLLQYYKEIVKTAPIEIYVTGNVDEENVTKLISDNFDLKSHLQIEREIPLTIPKAAVKQKRDSVNEKTEKKNIEQAKLCVCQTSGVEPVGDDYYKLLVSNAVLGGCTTSMLFQNLREKHSLCYYVNSVVYRFKGVIVIQAGIDEKSYTSVIEYIHKSNEDLKNGNFSEDILENAKKGLVNSFMMMNDTPGLISDYYLTSYILGDGTCIDEAIQKIKTITIEDVKCISQNINMDTVFLLKGCAV